MGEAGCVEQDSNHISMPPRSSPIEQAAASKAVPNKRTCSPRFSIVFIALVLMRSLTHLQGRRRQQMRGSVRGQREERQQLRCQQIECCPAGRWAAA